MDAGQNINGASPIKAVRALRFQFNHGAWTEKVRVVNNSYGGGKVTSFRDPLKGMKDNITLDLRKNDRVYVASAGNEGQEGRKYPAAYSNVLGVTGWYAAWQATPAPGKWVWAETGTYGGSASSSNYMVDGYATYEVSGIYAYTGHVDYIYSTYPPYNSYSGTSHEYTYFAKTSCCAPEISALAFQLYTKTPGTTSSQVWSHITGPASKHPDFTTPSPRRAQVVDYLTSLGSW
jgi:subtilisin family serine protease